MLTLAYKSASREMNPGTQNCLRTIHLGLGCVLTQYLTRRITNNELLHHNNDRQLDQIPEGRRTLFRERDQSAYVQASFLPKLKLGEFSGDPIDWPEWSSMFQSTIGFNRLSNDDKLAHLRTKLVGSAKRVFQGVDILVQ